MADLESNQLTGMTDEKPTLLATATATATATVQPAKGEASKGEAKPAKGEAATEDDEAWMALVDDQVLVSSLSIPGTHDSAAYTQPWPFVATQTMRIEEQLRAGIRYFDLRCGIVNDTAEMVHGPRLLGLRLQSVLDAMYAWLDSHATEGLIVQIKEDRKSEQSTLHFSHAIDQIIAARSARWRTATTTPSMRELRGKMQLFRRYNAPGTMEYGIDVSKWLDNSRTPFTIHTWHHVQLTIQDHYSFSEPMPLPSLIATKGGHVSELLQQAHNDPDPGHWYLNFTSAYEFNLYYQLTPRAIAVGGYYTFRWEPGMNPRLSTYLRLHPGQRRYGIVATDFPDAGGDDLIHLIIQSNFDPHPTSVRKLLALIVSLLCLGLLFHGWLVTTAWRNEMIRKANE